MWYNFVAVMLQPKKGLRSGMGLGDARHRTSRRAAPCAQPTDGQGPREREG